VGKFVAQSIVESALNIELCGVVTPEQHCTCLLDLMEVIISKVTSLHQKTAIWE
jgi:hypothetical protein